MSRVGWSSDEAELRLGYSIAACLFMGVAAAGVWVTVLGDIEMVGAAERIMGHPLDEIAQQWAAMQTYLLDPGDEALRVIGP